jgi:hypothetical protein
MRLTRSLSPVEPQPFEITESPTEAIAPKVASNGSDFVVVWATTQPLEDPGVHARTVSASGVAGESLRIATGGLTTSVLSVAPDGAQFAVAYTEPHLGSRADTDIVLTHIGRGDRVTVSSSSPDQHQAALVSAPGRPLRVLYARVAEEPEYGGVSRVFVRDLSGSRRRISHH